jgi:PPK2 family polyphosphate:nucleotide phosphotransferase
MSNDKNIKNLSDYLDTLRVKPGSKIMLKDDYSTKADKALITKEEAEALLRESIITLSELQEKLYAHNRYSVLIVLQAMDASGKDSMIKHVYSGLNPQGVKVTSFKEPSREELDHDYLWRHHKALPGRGEIAIFNRSHYENVLITRVHPEYILGEHLPGVQNVKDITKTFWEERYKQINSFEKLLAANGTVILKFFLYLSKEEQKKRFLERIEKKSKNWKFSAQDVEERKHWDKYMEAYEDMLNATSAEHAPWHVLPADNKWFTRLAMGVILDRELQKLDIDYPSLPENQQLELENIKARLLAEEE